VATEQQQDVSNRLKVINRFPQRMMFVVEPWGAIFWMEPGDTFEVIAQGPVGSGLELVLEAGAIEVWGWTGSSVAVYRDGERLDGPDDGEQPRVPGYPQPLTQQIDTDRKG